MKHLIFFLAMVAGCFSSVSSDAQCLNLIHYPADTVGWVHGSSRITRPAHYDNDTFVVCDSKSGQNSFIYNSIPVTLYGTASTFSMSFDFRIDSNNSCSDGLSFWFFTSSLYQLGSTSHEGGDKGFPDTTVGLALTFETIGCTDDIYLKKINSNSYNFCRCLTSTAGDTNICAPVMHKTFLTDSQWHHCIVNYDRGNITVSFDGGLVTMSGYSPISGTGHFGFMGTNGGGSSRKCLKNIQLCASLGAPTYASSTFGSYITRQCNGPLLTVQTNSYSPTYMIKNYYGDGSRDSIAPVPGLSGGIATFSHTYSAPGSYTIKELLYNGSTLLDSFSFLYENIFCTTLPVKFYNDVNNNCLLETGEPFLAQSVVTEIDSNGIPVDTICATSGFYYDARGSIGDIYSFKVLSTPGNMLVTCPSSGILYDSLVPGIFIYPPKYFGISCSSGSTFDLSVNAVIPVTGIHDQWGNAYVQNAYCAPTTGTLTLHYSKKYGGMPTQITPPASSVSVGTIVWNLSGLTSSAPGPVKLHWEAEHGTTPLTIRDTVYSYFVITPGTGDADTINNSQEILDTVKAGCDPNEIWVRPAGCLASGAIANQLQYVINFENTGNDTAHNIYVMDTLSDYLDVSTFSIEMATDEMYVTKLTYGAGHNILKFDFPHINLLDTSHHNLCDGGLTYNIKTKPGLANGLNIKNRAGIYFDVNDVVMTNQVTTPIGCPLLGVREMTIAEEVNLYPDPATDELNIENNGGYRECYVTNSVGKLILSTAINQPLTKVNIRSLPAGLYFMTFKGTNGNLVRKFVKL